MNERFSPVCAIGSVAAGVIIYLGLVVLSAAILFVLNIQRPIWSLHVPLWLAVICWINCIAWVATLLYPHCRRRHDHRR